MILVGVDDRPSARDALTLGGWLADVRSEELQLAWIHPYDRLPSLLEEGQEAESLRRSVEAMGEDIKASLPAKDRPEFRLVSGRGAARGLQELAEREQASLIALGASERAGLGRIVPGSTARKLLSGSSLPVVIAPRGYDRAPQREPVIGVGFDGGKESAEALGWAADQVRRGGGRLRLIAVHEPVPFARVSAGAGALPTDSVSAALRRELQQDVEKAVAELTGDLSIKTTLVDGDPAAALVAASSDLDLLVLGSRGYGPVKAVLLGSVSETTMGGAAAPTVVVPRNDR